MAGISLTERDLSNRRKDVIRLVAPLVADRNRIDARPVGAGQNHTLGVLPKGQAPAAVLSPDSIRVPTKVDGVFFNYYEVWILVPKTSDYLLERAYMHIHLKKTKDAPDRQLLCLHCDPLLKATDQSYVYKRGPHLHVGGAAPNIDRSHIAICLNDPQFGGADLQSLTQTFQAAIKMIEKEILPSYARV
ncbi:hypothetical protein [Microvirga sp. M2]|uniref:hypothetical protein n=1 Tax=Microvirga sp. M2 TaxID=3073270 RepID=UPI0039C4A53C